MKQILGQLIGDGRGGADEQALISLIGAVVFFGLQIYAVVVRGQAFDPMTFGTGFGTVLGATAAGFGLRAHLTPNQTL